MVKTRRTAVDDTRYWRSRLFQPVYTRNGRRVALPELAVRMQRGGVRHTFSLGTANKDKAARQAAGIHAHLVANGWESTVDRYGVAKNVTSIAAAKVTIGDYLTAAEQVFDRKQRTFRLYARYLRRVVSEIFGIDGGRARWDHRAGGRDAWVRRVNAVTLSALTPGRLQEWRVAFIRRASHPAARAAAVRTANSYLRCARCLFSPKIAGFVSEKLGLPNPIPFSGVKIDRPRPPKYQGRIDVPVLIVAARSELREADPDAYVGLLLAIGAGLRKGEIDALRWDQVDFGRQILRMEVSEHGDLKTEESADAVEIDEALTKELRSRMRYARGPFVIDSSRRSRAQPAGQYYRCEPVFQRLYRWLRAKGISDKKPLHVLRKEFGSIINQRHGLYAASAALRHRDISTTAAHYVANRGRIMFEFGELLNGRPMRALASIAQ